MKSKRIIIAILIIGVVFIFYLVRTSNNDISIKVDLSKVTKITAVTQMTEKPMSIIIPGEKWNSFADTLSKMSLHKFKDKNEKGWQYLFTVEYNDKSIMQISFLNDKITVNNKVYKVSNYNPNDLVYFFE